MVHGALSFSWRYADETNAIWAGDVRHGQSVQWQ